MMTSNDYPCAYFYVADGPHGSDIILMCKNGEVTRWRNAVTPDEARRLGMQLMAQADAAESKRERLHE